MAVYKFPRLFLVFVCTITAVRGNTDTGPSTKTASHIKQDILKRYNKTIPPSASDGTPFRISTYVSGFLLNRVDVKTGIVLSKIYHVTSWVDSRLEYEKQAENMTKVDLFISFSADEVWNPHLHSRNGYIFPESYEPVLVIPRGLVFQLEAFSIETLCPFNDASYFPYDEHQCDIIYSKMDREGQEIHLTADPFYNYLEKQYGLPINTQWKVINTPTCEVEIFKNLGGLEYQGIRLRFTIKRQEGTFLLTVICSALSALFVSSLSHLVEPTDGTLVRLSLSGFALTILACVNIFFQHHTPLDIEKPPILYTLCNLSFGIVLFSILQTIVANAILTRSTGFSLSPKLAEILKNPLCQLGLWIWGWKDAAEMTIGDKSGLVASEESGETEYSCSIDNLSKPQTVQTLNRRVMLVLVLDSFLFLVLLIIFFGFSLFVIFL